MQTTGYTQAHEQEGQKASKRYLEKIFGQMKLRLTCTRVIVREKCEKGEQQLLVSNIPRTAAVKQI